MAIVVDDGQTTNNNNDNNMIYFTLVVEFSLLVAAIGSGVLKLFENL